MACQAAFAVENTQLHESALQKQAFARDLDHNSMVLQGFLPAAPPQIPGYEFFRLRRSGEPDRRGDYFDYVPIGEGKLAVVLGDVAGKGMPAALADGRSSRRKRAVLPGGNGRPGSSPSTASTRALAAATRRIGSSRSRPSKLNRRRTPSRW